jgi:hypothetical protein
MVREGAIDEKREIAAIEASVPARDRTTLVGAALARRGCDVKPDPLGPDPCAVDEILWNRELLRTHRVRRDLVARASSRLVG